ncbi:hypothetical protein [Microbacterium soli]|uniref:Terminase small subunit n=1 Tax=Microbacterium soli TaxID=446075 RepID=A0ABP7NIJ7_9MICO
MAKASPRPHRAALTRMLRATGLAHVPEEAPLVELLRSLADELDNGGGSRPRIEYRNALRDARAVLNSTVRSPVRKAPDVSEPEMDEKPDPEPKPNDLAAFKQRKGISA